MKIGKKKLYRSKKNRLLTGTLGGVGELMGIDPTIVRVVWLVATPILGFVPGVLIYVIASVIIPKKKR